jgi:hypothetical protein
MVIHTFGDSHSEIPWNKINILCIENNNDLYTCNKKIDINIHYLGPKLCFSIGRDGINIKDGYNINNGDTVIFCFGEIDCRCHIYKHITKNNDYKKIIESIVHNYFIKIKNAVDMFDNLKTVIYNVVPPVQKKNTREYTKYPFLGTDEERKLYVLYFNKKLQEECNNYKFTFFDIYNNYTDDNGFLNKKLSDNSVHISDPIYIYKYIENNLL